MSTERTLLLFIAMTAAISAGAEVPHPRVVSADDLANYWTISNTSLEPTVPLGGHNMHAPGCATVSFVVDAHGNTSQLKVQRLAPPSDLGQVALSEAEQLTFRPAASNAERRSVFSWMIFPFNLPKNPAARTAVMKGCAIDRLSWKDR
ncbi:MAG: hypothetical protein WB784_08230 [Rhodanobacteraceae bacterium]